MRARQPSQNETNPPGTRIDGPAELLPGPPGHSRQRVLGVIGLALLVLWGGWWVKSFRQDRMASGRLTWVPILPLLAGDFRVHIDHVARVWAWGGNPYQQPHGSPCRELGAAEQFLEEMPTPDGSLRTECGICEIFFYPPMVPRLFFWVNLMGLGTAIAVWLGAATVLAVVGTWGAWRSRRLLELRPLPWTIVLAGVLFSTPMLLTMERGQIDVLILPLLLAGAWLLNSNARGAAWAAGSLLALATWLKFYPGLLLFGFIALRRWRGLAGYVAMGAAIGVLDGRNVLKALRTAGDVSKDVGLTGLWDVYPTHHSLNSCWPLIWPGTFLEGLSTIPGPAVALGVILPMVAWISVRVARGPNRDRVIYPLFLWLVAAGTFVPPISNDYNLIFLPMAALAVWDRRDPVAVHMLMALLVLWWQPLWLPIDGNLLLAFKLGGLLAVGMSIATRAAERDPRTIETTEWSGITVPVPHIPLRAQTQDTRNAGTGVLTTTTIGRDSRELDTQA